MAPSPAALLEDVSQVGGQPVGDVDHGTQARRAVEGERFPDARFGAEVPAAEQASAQRSGDQDQVAGPGPRAPDGPQGRGLAQEGHVDDQRAVPGVRVAADQVDLEPVGHPLKARVEALGDGDGPGSRQGHRDDRGPGQPRHRRDVGEVHPHSLVPDRLGPVAFELEMAAIHQHVGRDQELRSGSDVEDRTVVADAQNRASPGLARVSANPVDQAEFSDRRCWVHGRGRAPMSLGLR